MITRIVVCTLVGWGAMSANADATQWFAEQQPFAAGTTVVVATAGTLGLQVQAPARGKQRRGRVLWKTTCAVRGIEAFFNSPENGLGETEAISFSCAAAPCGEVAVTPDLPWTSVLTAPGWPLVDEWTAELRLMCASTNYGNFEGTLLPEIGDKDEQGSIGGKPKDDVDNGLDFSPKRGALVEPQSGDAVVFADTVGGTEGGNNYKLGSPGHDMITGECEPQQALCGPGTP